MGIAQIEKIVSVATAADYCFFADNGRLSYFSKLKEI